MDEAQKAAETLTSRLDSVETRQRSGAKALAKEKSPLKLLGGLECLFFFFLGGVNLHFFCVCFFF